MNSEIEISNLTIANHHHGIFQNCNFPKVNLRVSDFSNFEFIETKFNSSNSDLIGARSIKISISNRCMEIEKYSNLEKILKDMSLIISTNQY